MHNRASRRLAVSFLALISAVVGAIAGAAYAAEPVGKIAPPSLDPTRAAPAYPLKVSANNRYLVDQNNLPFLLVGDSPQSMIGNLSEADAATYMANRAKYGINTLWVSLLCNKSLNCRDSGATFDGIAPFTRPLDLSAAKRSLFPARRQHHQNCGHQRPCGDA